MELFAALDATWPAAERRALGPWTLRRGEGGGSRVSAATLDGPPADPAPAEAAMRQMGQRPLFMVRRGEAALDAALAARGSAVFDATLLMAGPVVELAAPAPDEAAIRCEAPLAAMRAIWERGGIGPARLAVMARAAGPSTYLLGRLGDRPAGAAFVACAGRIAMLHAMETAPEARRRGIGARLVRSAAAWARAQGADTLALAVTEANLPARRLYAGLGMRERTGYYYRTAPEVPPKDNP